ncbi:MAG TPA: HAMP domain-containing sensor histidine kinase [Pseudomonas sp.]|nr:HAMP domain-containing sensor histidine kinase [Pseudomonas sp.]
MRSIFWRILASFWLALALVAGLSLLLGRTLNQDSWILARHPVVKNLAERWSGVYEQQGVEQARQFLDSVRREHRIDVQVFGEGGEPLVTGTAPRRTMAPGGPRARHPHLPWRRLSTDYTSPDSGDTYLFLYRIPHTELAAWHRDSLLWPLSALGIALVVLTLFSLLLTLAISRPLNRLRSAVHDLGQTSYQQNSLAALAARRDEFGVLAGDFNRMGERLQGLISSQRQLLRDVSHELRSPLARLRIALALAERADEPERARLWPRLNQECDRLEALISEILALARLDSNPGPSHAIDIAELLTGLREDARLAAPDKPIRLDVENGLRLMGWPDMLERAVDNLLRNAQRFSPPDQPIEVRAERRQNRLLLSVRDHGAGVSEEHLGQLGEPFFRAPGQTAAGYGLGLAMARRAAERHGGQLLLANHAEGGFVATLDLPLTGSLE